MMKSAPGKQQPPFGKALDDKRQSANPPWLVIVCIGHDCWRRARQWQKNTTVWALVLPKYDAAASFIWLVSELCVLIDWDKGPNPQQILQLVKVLLAAGAYQVTVRPCWVDSRQLAFSYDDSKTIGKRWVQIREQIVTYPGLGGLHGVSAGNAE
jgi:hypothetical protein